MDLKFRLYLMVDTGLVTVNYVIYIHLVLSSKEIYSVNYAPVTVEINNPSFLPTFKLHLCEYYKFYLSFLF